MYASPTGARFYVTPAGLVGIGQAFYAPLTRLHVMETTTITNAVKDTLRIEARVSTAATGGAAGFGAGLSFFAEDATDTTYQQQALIASSWVDATDATRKAKLSLSAYDTAVRLGLEIEASGTAAKLGFFGATTVVQQLAATDLGVVLSNLGLRVAGTAYPITTSGAVILTGGLTINTVGATITDVDIVLGTTTGTKIGTATNQKLGFFNAAPVVQRTGIVDADGSLADVTTKFNTLITALETLGLLATV
jgi:hypothetical protein